MAERSFRKEVEALKLGDGETFRGEGILAVTKALLQSGVAYVGGYQGAPVSHLLDVLVDAEDIMADLGVHLETCTNEASAAAMLGASISYPLRGAVTWKSIVGTNVAADALSNLSSPGVIGGAMIIIGEDYGEGASIIQERSYAYAMKSSMWLLDPRPDLPTIVRMVEKGFELSEASHAPVMLELRIRACHVTGAFTAKNNRASPQSGLTPADKPARFDYAKLSHPPSTFLHERLKVEQRLPAAQAFARAHKLNEVFDGDLKDIGIVVLGGLTNTVLRALARLGLADNFGNTRVPIYCLNLAYPLIPDEVKSFCLGKNNVLIVEEGFPDYVEQAVNTELRRADIQTRIHGKGALPNAGEYTGEVVLRGLANFIRDAKPAGLDAAQIAAKADALLGHKLTAAATVGELPPRPPNFCTGCPERPVFAALKLTQRDIGPTHISTDIGCHSFATFAPFSMGNSILGYGMSLAAAAAVAPNLKRRPISVMGDGGFWHNGLITGVASNLFNKNDGVLIVMQNGYTSATGQQYMPSSGTSRQGTAPGMDIESTLRSFGVK
jgi:indolepyruvate ferredoxin oxidoreductase, alpha subunit